QLVGRAEHENLGARAVKHRYVAGRRVEGITLLVLLGPVGVLEYELALEHVAPMRALAAVVGQPLDQRSAVDVGAELREADGVALDLLAAIGHRAELATARRGVLGDLRHVALLLVACVPIEPRWHTRGKTGKRSGGCGALALQRERCPLRL